VVVATVESLLQRTLPKDIFTRASFELKTGAEYDLSALARRLADAGYSRCEQVEGVGQFALRGGILDVFSPPMRIP
jgi:transcription-repair coupling factor (superfamily II helicase)